MNRHNDLEWAKYKQDWKQRSSDTTLCWATERNKREAVQSAMLKDSGHKLHKGKCKYADSSVA